MNPRGNPPEQKEISETARQEPRLKHKGIVMSENILVEILTQFVWPLVQFLLGLGVVVFFHELGHFLAARWAGIKVERFAIGMGPRVCGFVRGETDYCLCAVPLGGYVKMLGQEDFKPVEGQAALDPRSFLQQSVGKRMVVIAAGVAMNVLLAALLFILVGMIGKKDNAPIVGEVLPTHPAAAAEIAWDAPADPARPLPPTEKTIQPGDRIVSLNGKPVKHFGDVQTAAILADKGEAFDLVLQRETNGIVRTGRTRVAVRFSEAEGINEFGLASAPSLTVGKSTDLLREIPFQSGDRIVAVAGRPVEHFWQLKEVARRQPTAKVAVTVEHREDKDSPPRTLTISVSPQVHTRGNIWYTADGSRVTGWPVDPPAGTDEPTARTHVYLQTPEGEIRAFPKDDLVGGARSLLDVLGMTPRLRVEAVVKGGVFFPTPARKAGLQPGDIILSYADRPTPGPGQFLRISEEIGANPTRLVVLRDGKVQTLSITPAARNGSVQIGIVQGLDYAHPIVGAVRKNSPAARIGLEAGAEITAVNEQPVRCWQDLVAALARREGQKVVLRGRLGGVEKTWDLGVLDRTRFDPAEYEWTLLSDVPFEPLSVTVAYRNPFRAVAWGAAETARLVVLVYKSFGAMLRGSVSPSKAVQGPIGIGSLALSAAREDFLHLVRLMAFLSVALAVFNFLPIPVLDGGHALLLVIEKLRGRPLPIRFVNALQMVFLTLILGLFVLISWNDVFRIVQSLW